MMLRTTAVLFVLALGSTLAFADPERKKLQVFEDIQQQVNRYYYFTVFDDISVAIDEHGVVALTGQVTNPYKSNEIAKRVAGVEGSAVSTMPSRCFRSRGLTTSSGTASPGPFTATRTSGNTGSACRRPSTSSSSTVMSR